MDLGIRIRWDGEADTYALKGMKPWNEVDPVTRLGVEGMNKVPGIGYHTKTFELPEDWVGNIGAYLKFDHNSDMIAYVTINGHRHQVANQISDLADARKFFKKGTNTIVIKLDTTLQNRDPAAIEKITYGLTGVTLIPYCKTAL